MSFSIGIIGLPNVGKSTLFKALTRQAVDISNYPFCTIDPNVGIVEVPDERLEKISSLLRPEKCVPTVIEFIDIAGLVKNAHQGEGLGNQFLSHIRKVDAICHVVRAFEDDQIAHIEEKPDIQRDIHTINIELMAKDLETVEKRIAKAQKTAKSGDILSKKELVCLLEIKKQLEQEKPVSKMPTEEEHQKIVSELSLITNAPSIYVFNIKDKEVESRTSSSLCLNLKHEAEISELTPQEQKELELAPSQINKLINLCYQALNLITFYTVKGGKETRAWTIRKNLPASTAGGIVHSDFEDKFIRAEIINWQILLESGGWQKAKEKGLIRTEGKNYPIQDGEVIEFKI